MRLVLLIGGPGSVLGARLIELLSREGYRVVATYDAERDAGATSTDAVAVPRLDVTDPGQVQAVVDAVERDLGGIDVLINNAGIFEGGPLPLAPAEQWRRVLEVNLLGTYHACKAVGRKMMARRHGRIVNVASLKGVLGGAGESAYAASKAGVLALTKSLARDVAGYGVAVNAVCPGFIPSSINRYDPRAEAAARAESLLPIEHNRDDAANFIAFLCSDRLTGVTGQVFFVDSRIH